MKLEKILETALYVHDLAQAEKFYVDILNLEVVRKTPNRDIFLRCGNTMLLLFNPEATKIDGGLVPTHGVVGAGHMAFGIPNTDFEKWEEHLVKNGIAIEKKVDWRKDTHSLYFRDPSGNSLEFASENLWF